MRGSVTVEGRTSRHALPPARIVATSIEIGGVAGAGFGRVHDPEKSPSLRRR
jgi:hypothetical protein